MMFKNVKIKKRPNCIEEFTLDGKPVELSGLISVDIKMVAAKKTLVTLEYHVNEVEIEELDEPEEVVETTFRG